MNKPPAPAAIAKMRARARFLYEVYFEDGAPSWDEVVRVNTVRIHAARYKLGLISEKQLRAELRKLEFHENDPAMMAFMARCKRRRRKS